MTNKIDVVKRKTVPAYLDHDLEMINELREDPDYAEVYLQTALEGIYEPGGIGALREDPDYAEVYLQTA